MPRSAYFITHPNVVISREVPVPRWPLSELGRSRMRQGLAQSWVRELTAIYCSTEQKAIGAWKIAEIERNVPAQRVWRRVIGEYTDGRFSEEWSEAEPRGPMQVFSNLTGD